MKAVFEFHRNHMYNYSTLLKTSLSLSPSFSPHLNIITDATLMCGYLDEPLASLLHLPQLEMTLANKQPVRWVEAGLNCT